MSAEVICMANFKGGVGKSTTAVNLAACIAKSVRTLLADCDPQANASEMFIPETEIEFDFRSIIADRVPSEKVVRTTRIENLEYVLPASFDLALLDKELVVTANGVQRIERALRPLIGSYDFVILDTGPNLSHLTLGALAAAQHIIIPVSATVWSTTGLRKFIRWIDANRDNEVVGAELLGLLATMVMARTRIGRDVVGEMRQSPFPYFETTIPDVSGAEDAVMDRAVAGEPGVDQKFSEAYLAFAEEVIARVAATAKRGAHRASARSGFSGLLTSPPAPLPDDDDQPAVPSAEVVAEPEPSPAQPPAEVRTIDSRSAQRAEQR